jgi:hypothetical protein
MAEAATRLRITSEDGMSRYRASKLQALQPLPQGSSHHINPSAGIGEAAQGLPCSLVLS